MRGTTAAKRCVLGRAAGVLAGDRCGPGEGVARARIKAAGEAGRCGGPRERFIDAI